MIILCTHIPQLTVITPAHADNQPKIQGEGG